MLYRIIDVKPRGHYRAWVCFEDGVEGEVDLSDLAGRGVFKRWEDPAEFDTVRIDPASGTLAWDGGLDVAPDALYRELVGVTSR